MKLNRIKLVLVEKEVSQTELAKKLGKSFSTINAYCSNRKQPSLELLNEIADILSVSMKDLIVDKYNRMAMGFNENVGKENCNE